MAEISIIVPVYNKEEYLGPCIESILDQTFKDFELIIINDGSTDNCPKIIDKLAASDHRIKTIHQQNGGVSSARNAGLASASGNYIGFVDADDILETNMYRLLLNNLEKHDADISICGVKRLLPGRKDIGISEKKLEVFDRDEALSKFFEGIILMSTYEKLFKRELVAGLEYRPALFEDTFYNFEAIKRAHIIVFDHTPMYLYIIRDNSHSMAAYGPKYLNMVRLSQEIVSLCRRDLPKHLKEAESFDFNLNMFILNLILLSRDAGNKYELDYREVKHNLKKYRNFFLSGPLIKLRYRLGYLVFILSGKLYENLLRIYTSSSKSENQLRNKKLN
ncbi:MAG: glycosyltransferase [Leeuwenhoekiella sp.]